ncbi:Malectin-like domain [Dillenia turbinata]|uniref:Malectin-like domain n=1 Tax=Dillenia turbinata TaxID=194707 RepID=A0AAN8VFZ9_9MAGN
MEKWLVWFFLFCMLNLKVSCQDSTEWISIDCGADTNQQSGPAQWQTDEDFIKTGTNHKISSSSPLGTLRFFTQQNKNCYTLPATPSTQYLIRAAFYYGDYDDLLQPPVFDLALDENKWTTVITVNTTWVYHEVIYTSKRDHISVCLIRTKDKQYPFISSLESTPLSEWIYPNMTRDLAWLKSYRYAYGASKWIFGYMDDDRHNRFWEPWTPEGLVKEHANFSDLKSIVHEDPPIAAILQGVKTHLPNETLSLSFFLSKISSTNFVIAYYTEPEQKTTSRRKTRSFNFSINDLGGNSLKGSIPDFIGNLPNLTLLNLQNNDFSGKVPKSISNNKKLVYNVTGNPNLEDSHRCRRNREALIIGLAVGIPSGLVLLVALVYFRTRKQLKPNQGQIPDSQLGRIQGGNKAQGKTEESTVTVSASMKQSMRPSQTASTPALEKITVAVNGKRNIN